MKTKLAEELGLKYPIFAFTRDAAVAAEVSNMGGMGVIAAIGTTVDEFKASLDYIKEHAPGKPFGIDVVIPAKVVAKNEQNVDAEALKKMIPQEQWDFIEDMMKRYDIPQLPPDVDPVDGLYAWTDEVTRPQVEMGMEYGASLLANALGPPPKHIVEQAHAKGIKVAALTGSPKHAQNHLANGVDILIAQGTEAGGHCGEISTMVLVPEIVDMAGDAHVLAAGGIGDGRQVAAALALGAQGVWCGSIWLTAAEADSVFDASKQKLITAGSRDTVRSTAWTGKPARQLKTPWTEEWDNPDNPDPMGMPLHWMVTGNAFQRIYHYINDPTTGAANLSGQPVGQIVGRMNKIRPTREIMQELIDQFEVASAQFK